MQREYTTTFKQAWDEYLVAEEDVSAAPPSEDMGTHNEAPPKEERRQAAPKNDSKSPAAKPEKTVEATIVTKALATKKAVHTARGAALSLCSKIKTDASYLWARNP